MTTSSTTEKNPNSTDSVIEQYLLQKSPFHLLYPPVEKIKTIVLENFPALGKSTALRFLEWVQQNPGGVISLPTGKTPEHFIMWVKQLLSTWDTPYTQEQLAKYGLNPQIKPDMKSLHFVQIDEFYPIDSSQKNSFYSYVNHFYIEGFGLDPAKALLIDSSSIGLKEGQTLTSVWPEQEVDLTLRYRQAATPLEREQQSVLARIDQWCQEYEDNIRALGGIGFFLGGIGPDGHIGFNVRGSDHYSTTRLTETNYETQAAAATDLGGIETSRKRLVITIGLGTITYNPNCVAIIMAAGEAKALVIKNAIEGEKDVLIPASSLQTLPLARFYVTRGAIKKLEERQFHLFQSKADATPEEIEQIVIDLAVKKRKSLLKLTKDDFVGDRFGAELLKKTVRPVAETTQEIHDRLVQRISHGREVLSNTRFLHTEPHHDDLMLGYLAGITRNIRDASNTHHFVTLTSGFTAVTNRFFLTQLEKAKLFLGTEEWMELLREDYFDPTNITNRNRDIWRYLDGVAANNEALKDEGVARRMLRNLIELYGQSDLDSIQTHILEIETIIQSAYPGKKDPVELQKLKGMLREWEAECLWGYSGWSCENIHHLRLGFYTGDIFTEEPTLSRDVPPVLDLLKKVNPDVVGVALDPEASGPDTHYKVMQAISEALRLFSEETGRKDIKVWGYRNVWFRFHPSEANLYFPVSLNMFSVLQAAFLNTFLSQKEASFPSYEYDGPFCDLAQAIQVNQYQILKTCLGREWFHQNPSPLIRATRGMTFVKEMTLEEFHQHSRSLRAVAENR
ncbi:MAG: glucosamine-6-phosphate deaminase [bacterium]|jgi:glucosamine-6-phosphate deaminase|nr:glucosamine-6-phosphate deaminase [bacterium]